MKPVAVPSRPAAPVSYARMLIRAQRRFHALNGAAPPPSAAVLGFPLGRTTRAPWDADGQPPARPVRFRSPAPG